MEFSIEPRQSPFRVGVLGEHQSPSRVDVVVEPAFTNLIKVFDAMIRTKVFLKKGEGASLKTPALPGEKSATLTLCYLIIQRSNNSHSGGPMPSLFENNKL
jgi:hypothetical protein